MENKQKKGVSEVLTQTNICTSEARKPFAFSQVFAESLFLV